MAKVLLLNPPGTRNFIRDYFCSKLAKSNYKSPPVALLMLSGRIAEVHEMQMLDAIVENLSIAKTLDRIRKFQPGVIVCLVGAASWEEDQQFLKEFKALPNPPYVIALGDVLLEDAEKRLQEVPEIDAVLYSFVTSDVLTLISHHDGSPIPNALYRHPQGKGLVQGGLLPMGGDFHLPAPRHEALPLRKYRFPFMVAHPMSAMLTDYGCPFKCTFCVIPGLGFGVRPLEDILEELRHLAKLGVREIFFLDQTFGARRERTLELCRAMKSLGLRFQWSCFSRADVVNEEMLKAMATAGCHTIIFGVESGSNETLQAYNKKMSLDKIRATLQACRRIKIRTAATFMLGLPGEREAQARATIALALELPLDFAAFNVAIPRAGTPLRKAAIAEGLISSSVLTMDQSGIEDAMATRELTSEQILGLRREAIRRFYLRPGYLLHRLLHLRSWSDLKAQISDGLGVVADALRPGGNPRMEKQIYHDLARAGNSYWWNQGRQDLVRRLFERYRPPLAGPGLKILDIGCAAGGTLSAMAKWGEAWGLDISTEAIRLCQAWGIPKQRLVLGSAENMRMFKANCFDLVTAVEILEHLGRPAKALTEIQRILKPGGLLIMTVPADQKLWSSRDERLGHRHRYSVKELAESVIQAGLEVLAASYANAFYYWPYRLLLRLRKWQGQGQVPKIETNTYDVPLLVNACLAGWLRFENALILGVGLPFGVSAVCVARKKERRS